MPFGAFGQIDVAFTVVEAAPLTLLPLSAAINLNFCSLNWSPSGLAFCLAKPTRKRIVFCYLFLTFWDTTNRMAKIIPKKNIKYIVDSTLV